MKVLIGYDGSSCADGALLDLRRAGLPQTVETVIMCVADVLMPSQMSPGRGIDEPLFPPALPEAARKAWAQVLHAIKEAEALAKQAAERLQTCFPTWKIHAEARADSPAWELVKKPNGSRQRELGQPPRSPVRSGQRRRLSHFSPSTTQNTTEAIPNAKANSVGLKGAVLKMSLRNGT
jgi:hypothetical protein